LVSATTILLVALLAFVAIGSRVLGAAMALYLPASRLLLSGILAFAAGALISALAIELAYEGAVDLHEKGISANSAWALIGGGFAVGAVIYYATMRYLERKGSAILYPTRFREYALERKREDTAETIELLARCELLRHLPPQAIQEILPCIRNRSVAKGEVVFHRDDEADALYIVAKGKVHVIDCAGPTEHVLAELGPGQAFGEMALVSGDKRTATVRAVGPTELCYIEKKDFDDLIAADREMAEAVERLSHQRAIKNLSLGKTSPEKWARIASSNLDRLSRKEADRFFNEAAHGAGLAIVFANLLDTIPACLVIGSKFVGFGSMSISLPICMFLAGIPEAAVSAIMLKRARYSTSTIFLLWSAVLLAGVLAAVAGHVFLSSDSAANVVIDAVAGGAVLALVAHSMIPEAIEDAGSAIVLPTVGGFLFAFYLAISESLH
jgi:CRP-like cAMP-binding protein